MNNNSIASNRTFLQAISGIAVCLSILLTVLTVWTMFSSEGFLNYVLLGVTMITSGALILNAIIATDEWTAHMEQTKAANENVIRIVEEDAVAFKKVS
jgi:hypothetical protein